MKRRAAGLGLLDGVGGVGALGAAGGGTGGASSSGSGGAGARSGTGRVWGRRAVAAVVCVGVVVVINMALLAILDVPATMQLPQLGVGGYSGRARRGADVLTLDEGGGGGRRRGGASAGPGTRSGAVDDDLDHDAVFMTIFTVLKEQPADALARASGNMRVWSDYHTLRVAIRSWVRLPVHILLFADDATCALVSRDVLRGLDATAAAQRVRCEPFACVNPQYGAPTYDCIFARARAVATTPLLMYSNSDIVFFRDVCDVARAVAARLEDFVVVGKRRDVRLPVLLDPLDPTDAAQMQLLVRRDGVLHGKFGIDYFIFRRRHLPRMLPFLVGRVRWDNWLLAQYLRWPHAHSIDATAAILAGHHSLRQIGESASRPGSTYNVNMTLGTVVDPKKVGSIEQTEWAITDLGPNPLFPPARHDRRRGAETAAAVHAAIAEGHHPDDNAPFPETQAAGGGGSDGAKRAVQSLRGTTPQTTSGVKANLKEQEEDNEEEEAANAVAAYRAAVVASCERAYGGQNSLRAKPVPYVPMPRRPSQFLAVEHGACQARCCRLMPSTIDLDSLLYATEVDRTVVLVPVPDKATLPLALNWQCHARRTGVRNAIFLAMDDEVGELLGGLGLPWMKRTIASGSAALAQFETDLARPPSDPLAGPLASQLPVDVLVARAVLHAGALVAALDATHMILRKQVGVVLMRPDAVLGQNVVPVLLGGDDSEGIRGGAALADVQGQLIAETDNEHGTVASGLLRFAPTVEGRELVYRWRSSLAVQVDALVERARTDPQLPGELTEGLPFDPYMMLSDLVRRRRPRWAQLTSAHLQTQSELRAAAEAGPPVWPLVVDAEVLPNAITAALPFNVTTAIDQMRDAGLWLSTLQGHCRPSLFPPLHTATPSDLAAGAASARNPRRLTLILTMPPGVPSAQLAQFEASLFALDTGPAVEVPDPGGSTDASAVDAGTRPWTSVNVVVLLPPMVQRPAPPPAVEERSRDAAPAEGQQEEAGEDEGPADAEEEMCDRLTERWQAGTVRCLRPTNSGTDTAALPSTPPLWADAWYPRDDDEMGIFLTAPDVFETDALRVLRYMVDAVVASAPAAALSGGGSSSSGSSRSSGSASSNSMSMNANGDDGARGIDPVADVYGIGLVGILKAVPFAKKPVGLARPRASDGPPLVLWRYQRSMASGMAWFGGAYGQYLAWLHAQWPRQPTGWSPTVAGTKPLPVTDPVVWQNRFVAERGCYAVYPGPGLGTLVTPVAVGGPVPPPAVAAGDLPPLPPLAETPLYDLYANRVLDGQRLDGRAFTVDRPRAL
jgi:hypothetical protein